MKESNSRVTPGEGNLSTIGIVGAGSMGRGIVQIAAAGGFQVLIHDAQPGAAVSAKTFVTKMLTRAAEKGKMSEAAAKAALDRIVIADSLDGFARCSVVIEAIVEDLEAKRELFRTLERIVDSDCILATNTSSLSVTAIAAACQKAERVAGFHFFNPVPLMKLVEIIGGLQTADWVMTALNEIGQSFGHKPVRATDTPGFIVNHAGRGFVTEALRILSEGIAPEIAIDRVLREGAGFRMGPFELLDLTGLDVSHPVMESIYEQYYQEPRFRPSAITRTRVAAGLFGRKSGRGFYTYANGRVAAPTEPDAPAVKPETVWVGPSKFADQQALITIIQASGTPIEDGDRPSSRAVCIVTPVGEDTTAAALAQNLDPRRTVAVDTLFGLSARRTLMKCPITDPAVTQAAHGLLAHDGTPVNVIHDSPGFIAQRVLACVVNIACDIAQQGIAQPADIDRAATLGLGYPTGPLAWGDAIGADKVLRILENMQRFYGDPRYRPSPWLTRRARLGVSLSTPEN